MHKVFISSGIALFVLSANAPLAWGAKTTDPATRAKAQAQYEVQPLSFELNEGQSDSQVKALARGQGYGLFLTNTESVLVVAPGQKSDNNVLRVRTVGSNPNPRISGVDRRQAAVNYIIGNDATKWRHNVATYSKVKYEAVYPGVDLIYYGNQRELEYDFVVAPGADPSSIRLGVEGARKVRIDKNGDLVLEMAHGAIRHHKPVIYQQVAGVRKEIAGGFVMRGKQIGFALGEYDRNSALVIDPSLTWRTYLGGSGVDQGKAIVIVSLVGFTLIGGSTSSTNFPTSGSLYPYKGATDGFVSAFDASGTTLLVSTFLGGTGDDIVNAVAIDSATIPNMLYVAGATTSHDFPTVNPLQAAYGGGPSDGFVVRVDITNPFSNPTGVQVNYATYLGGAGAESVNAIAMDQSTKDLYVTGVTTSTNFPVTAGVFQTTNGGGVDAFVTRIGSTTARATFSTYLGGTGYDQANGIAVYTNLSVSPPVPVAYVTGVTTSTAFAGVGVSKAVISGNQSFLTAVNATGTAKLFNNFLGGATSVTTATSVTADATGNAYIAGSTNDPMLPLLGPIQGTLGGVNDAFVVEYGPTGLMKFGSYWGGTGFDKAFGIGVFVINNSDLTVTTNIFFGGLTTGGLPTLNAIQGAFGGGSSDGFVAMFTSIHGAPFVLGYSTYMGGAGDDTIAAIAVGTSGNARVAGTTNSSGFATAGTYQTTFGGAYDAFAAQITTVP